MESRHVFHTRHDFTPEFAWAAFQLLAEFGDEGLSPTDLHDISKATASPLSKRADLNKVLAGMEDVGLIERGREHVALSPTGKRIAASVGRYKEGFHTAVHCLYFWTWQWKRDTIATPSWSYREVCRQLLNAGPSGIEGDELVLRLVATARNHFDAEKISFSKASVTGVTMWLEAQPVPLIHKIGGRIYTQRSYAPTAASLSLNIAALCLKNSGEATLDPQNLRLLAECLLIPVEDLSAYIASHAQETKAFLFVPSTPNRLVLAEMEDPLIGWMAEAVKKLA
jgi:hypothetical protein